MQGSFPVNILRHRNRQLLLPFFLRDASLTNVVCKAVLRLRNRYLAALRMNLVTNA